MLQLIINFVNYFIRNFARTFGIYIIWIVLHYIATHLYVQYCTPKTPVGFILSLLYSAAPHCHGLRWVIYHGGNSISVMWLLFGTWIMGHLIPINREH